MRYNEIRKRVRIVTNSDVTHIDLLLFFSACYISIILDHRRQIHNTKLFLSLTFINVTF